MAKQLELEGLGRGELVTVTPAPQPLLGELVTVTLVVWHQAPVLTQSQRGPTLLKMYQPNLREAFLEMFGGPIESNVYDAPGQTPPLGRQTPIPGWTSTSGDRYDSCGPIARVQSGSC